MIMKKILAYSLLSLLALQLGAQQSETFKKKGKTLVFINEDPELNPKVQAGLVRTFFKVYPKLVKTFNRNAVKDVEVRIDTAYTGVAYAHNGKITISSEWLRKKPGDLDVITHETMHLVQAYPSGSGPGWITEGIADYVRYIYGVDNEGAGWSLPEYKEGQHYTDSYRITARFFFWLSLHYKNGLLSKLDKNMRNATYNDAFWQKETGYDLETLWQQYTEDPDIS